MPLAVPNLDDWAWEDLVNEARSLIPRVSPPWTDHNVHDPGITFIELFAWLAEMQLYQLNRVGRRQRELFAELAGVSRETRTPARVNIRVEGQPPAGEFIAAGTQLVPTEGEEIIFETDTDLFLTRTRLVKVLTDDGSGPTDQTQANDKPGIVFLAFGETAGKAAELRLGFDRFYPEEQPELTLTANVFTDDLVERCGPDSPLKLTVEQRVSARVDLAWEYLGPGQKWLPLQVLADTTGAFLRAGAITLEVPKDATSQLNLFWIRARIRDGYYDIEPRLRSISLNVLPSSQRETVRNELLGTSTGKPDQSFTLAKKSVLIPERARRGSVTSSDIADWDHLVRQLDQSMPELASGLRESLVTRETNSRAAYERIKSLNQVVANTTNGPHQTAETEGDDLDALLGGAPVVIEVDGEVWRRVSSFKESGPRSKHFVFDPETRLVEFGNGLNGQVPASGQQVRALWYQASNGGSGNVAKGLNWKFRTGGNPGLVLTNPEPATSGADPETLDQLELRTRALLNRPQRAVTIKDLELLALSTPDAHVARAKAITNCPVPESITVVVFPKVRPGRKGPPKSPSPRFLEMVQANLQRHRILCDRLHVVPPVYIEVKVSARLRLSKGASENAVLARARQAVDSFLLGALTPADQGSAPNSETVRGESTQSACFTRWPFGRYVFPSEVYAILDGVAGIDFASDLSLSAARGGSPVAANNMGAIPIPPVGLVFPGEHSFTVEFDIRRNA